MKIRNWGLIFLMIFIFGCGEGELRNGGKEETVEQNDTLDTVVKDLDSFQDPLPSTPFEELVATYERPDRSDWQKPNEVIELLGDNLNDKIVAEIGAGSGYFTFRLVPRVEKIIAIDIDPRMLEFIDSCTNIYLPEKLQDNIETRLAKPNNPMLAPGEVDIVLLANTYTFIENRIDYFSRLRKNIKPGGRLVIVDYKKRHLPVGPAQEYKLPLYKVEEELLKAGYTQVYADDQLLPYQYVVVALLN